MGVVHLERPIQIVRRSGWAYTWTFWLGLPPASAPDDLSGYSAEFSMVPQSAPGSMGFTFTTGAGSMMIDANRATVLIGRGDNAYWPVDDYDGQLRIYRPEDLTDRYVVRTWHNKSPLKVIAPPAGITPIPGGGSNIMLPLSFSQGYAPNEALPGYELLDLVNVTGGASAFASLMRPTGVVVFGIRRNGLVIGTATMDPATCGAGPVFNGVVAFTADPFTFNPGDFLDWTAPAVIDATFKSGAVTLSGT